MTLNRWRTWPMLVLLFSLVACQATAPTATPPGVTLTAAEAGVTPQATTAPAGTATTSPAGAATATAALATAAPTEAAPAYALQLRAALAACETAARDQVCFGQGPVTLTAQPGVTLPAFAQPGDVVNLADVAGLSLGGDGNWGVAVLRLQAGLDDLAQNLTVVAMGPAEITKLATVLDDTGFAWDIAGSDEAGAQAAATPGLTVTAPALSAAQVEPLQSFSFTSQPPAADDAPPSGLFLMSPWAGDLAGIAVNGTPIVLGSMAFIQTEPGGAISVGMFEGGSLVTVGEATFSVPAGAQATVPTLTADGAAPAAPELTALDPRAQAIANAVAQYGLEASDPRADAIAAAVAQYGQSADPRSDLIAAAVAQYAQSVARYDVQQFRRAIRRCTNPPNAHYVYNVLYWDNKVDTLRGTPELAAVLGANGLAELEAGARRCLSFELDFSSTVEVTSPEVTYVVEVKAEAIKLQYAHTGFMAQAAEGVLTHVRFDVTGDEGSCPSTTNAPDGTLKINGGFLRVNTNKLDVLLDFWPEVQPEQVIYNCPGATLPLLFPWFSIFAQAHKDQRVDNVFRFNNWHVSQNEHFAETIYDINVPMDELSGHVTTYMVLVHTPQAAP